MDAMGDSARPEVWLISIAPAGEKPLSERASGSSITTIALDKAHYRYNANSQFMINASAAGVFLPKPGPKMRQTTRR